MTIEVWFVTNILQTDFVLIAVFELLSIKVIGFIIIIIKRYENDY